MLYVYGIMVWIVFYLGLILEVIQNVIFYICWENYIYDKEYMFIVDFIVMWVNFKKGGVLMVVYFYGVEIVVVFDGYFDVWYIVFGDMGYVYIIKDY